MKVKHYKIIAAYKALNELLDKELPAGVSFPLFKLRCALKPHWEYQQEIENGLFSKYGTESGDGNIAISDPESRMKFVNKLTEVGEIEDDLDIAEIEIKLPDDMPITISQIEKLSEFATFK